MKRLLSISLMIIFGYTAYGQLAEDALRLSTLKSSLSTARTASVAGAFGAMGEDFGVLNINPAGLASYYESEISISPSLNFNSSTASLVANAQDTDVQSFGLGNVGVVFASQPLASSWSSSNFAIGVNKQNIFSQNFLYEGSTPTSIVDRFSQVANGKALNELSDFEDGLAYDVVALYDFDETNNSYSSDFDNYNGNVFKSQSVTRTGKINELTFAWAGSLDKKISFGASIGVPLVSFETTKVYQETDRDNEIDFFERLSYSEYVSTSGTGINFKLGTTYTGLKNFRFGLAIHSPNWYSLTDDFVNNLSYTFIGNEGAEVNDAGSPDGSFNYRLATPWKYVASAGSLFKVGNVRGFVNADFEFINYASSAFNLTSSDLSGPGDAAYQEVVNADISDQYQQVMNLRLGSELGYKMWRFRGGIALDASPYVNGSAESSTTVGLGVGIKQRTFSFDLAFQALSAEESYSPYRLIDESQNPVVNVESSISNLSATFGFRF